jgi:hypothetical protein
MSGTGTALLDFGAFPGATDASIAVTGQTGIVSGSLVECWVLPADTADHLSDEHLVEQLDVFADTIVAGTGFTIHGVIESTINEPAVIVPSGFVMQWGKATPSILNVAVGSIPDVGGNGMTLYGKWNIAWAWV